MLKKLLVIQILTMTVMVAVHLFAPPAFAGLYRSISTIVVNQTTKYFPAL